MRYEATICLRLKKVNMMEMNQQNMNQNNIEQAVNLLKSGELVAFPTETVYGLGADASNSAAVRKIFEAKNRPADHPVILHIYDQSQLDKWVESVPDIAYKLMQHFWPGALTLIFKARKTVSGLITGNQDTIGLRMPSNPIARELLKQFGGAIAAPSANRFGKISPTKASHVWEELGDKVKLIIDGGDCSLGIESTIIDVTKIPPVLLRPGPLDVDLIKQISGVGVIDKGKDKNNNSDKDMPRVSGSLASHYAPKTPVKLFTFDELDCFAPQEDAALAMTKGVMSFRNKPTNLRDKIIWVKMSGDAVLYAHELYAVLRELDSKNLEIIYIELPPDEIIWQAIRDRLQRAAG